MQNLNEKLINIQKILQRLSIVALFQFLNYGLLKFVSYKIRINIQNITLKASKNSLS